MPRLQPLALAYFVLATLTSAAGVRGIGDDVVAPDQPESRELDLVRALVERGTVLSRKTWHREVR